MPQCSSGSIFKPFRLQIQFLLPTGLLFPNSNSVLPPTSHFTLLSPPQGDPGGKLEPTIYSLTAQVGLPVWKSNLAKYLIGDMLILNSPALKDRAQGNNSKGGAMHIYTWKYSAPLITEQKGKQPAKIIIAKGFVQWWFLCLNASTNTDGY